MDGHEIEEFWNNNPCGESLIDTKIDKKNVLAFLEDYDAFRYDSEGHILACLDNLAVGGKSVLEIGLGQGADSEQLIRRGAKWSGLDITDEAVARVRARFLVKELEFQNLRKGSVLAIPFDDNSFDMIYSHGVLHHVPDIKEGQKEIKRVLRPDGELVVMLYAKHSLNYLFSIAILRRLALFLLYPLPYPKSGNVFQHKVNARKMGLYEYLKLKNFIHTNTDGANNPYSKVYDLDTVQKDFPDFEITKSYRRFMHAPPLHLSKFPGGSIFGWHLWVHLRPRQY